MRRAVKASLVRAHSLRPIHIRLNRLFSMIMLSHAQSRSALGILCLDNLSHYPIHKNILTEQSFLKYGLQTAAVLRMSGVFGGLVSYHGLCVHRYDKLANSLPCAELISTIPSPTYSWLVP